MTKTVLVSGIGGSIGIHVLAQIMKTTDWGVVGIDSWHHKGYRDRYTQLVKDNPDLDIEGRTRLFQHDLTCPISYELQNELGSVDYILHLAAMSDVFFSIQNPVFVVQNNVNSTLMMLEYARLANPEAFVYFSTDETMGPVEVGQAHAEGESHRPSNAYAAAKAASEDLCYSWWRSYSVPLIITRTMNNFGTMQSASKFPALVQRKLSRNEKISIHGTEEKIGTRFYIDSTDTALALIYILQNLQATLHKEGVLDEPDIYHITGDKAISNLEMAQLIADLMDKELDYELVDFHKYNPAHDIHYGLLDNKLRPKWKPVKSIEERLAEVIKWQEENPEWLQ